MNDLMVQEQFDAEELAIRNEVATALGDNPTLEACAEQYFLVNKCWNNYDECVRHNMTFERACHTLREVRDATYGKPGGNKLSMAAHDLLWEIVDNSAIVPEVETPSRELRIV